MIDIQVGTHFRMDTRWTFAFFAYFHIDTMQVVHVGRRSAQVTQIAFEIGLLSNLSDFLQNGLLASGNDKFTLMGRNSTKCTAAKATPM